MTEKIKFYYYNLIDKGPTLVSGGAENALYPSSNLKSPFTTKTYRSTASSDSVVFDFITTEPVDSILVLAHPVDGFGFNGALTIEANATNTWGSPAFSTTLTPNSEFGIGVKTLTAAESYRYWRVTGTGTTYFELGKMFIGSSFQPQRNIGNSFTFENRDTSNYQTSDFGQRFVDAKIDRKFIRGQINLIDVDNVDAFLDFINYVGRKKPFWCVLNESQDIINEKERFSGMYFFRDRPDARHVLRGIYNFTLTMEGAG